MPRRDFHFAGHAVRVEAAGQPLAWLQEFVTPHFVARNTDAPERTIVLTIDAMEHARLAVRGPHPHRLLKACFTLDSGIVSGRVWNGPRAGEVVLDGELGTFYRRAQGEESVVELVAARDGAEARLALLRAVREYAMLYAARGGWLALHAAAVAVADGAFVIAGPKRAGKTTLLLHGLHNEHGAYIANDRVTLSAEPSGVTAHGLPTIVRIRKESAGWFADLSARFERAGYHYSRRAAERNGEREVVSTSPAPTWGLSPPQLCHVLRAPIRASARVTAVLFPRLGAPAGSVTFEELSAGQALEAWRETLLRSCPLDGMFTIGPRGTAPPEGDGDRLAAGLAARVPSFACHLGPDAYGEGHQWLSGLVRQRGEALRRSSPPRSD